ncbi:MAG: permease, partial [Proteobacteria bacterium]
LAAALILLVGAGLLGRSLLRVLSTDPGFHTDHVLTLNLALPDLGDNAPDTKVRRVAFLSELFRRLRELPGVEQVGGTGGLPLTDSLANGTYAVMSSHDPLPKTEAEWEALFRRTERTGNALYCVSSEGYFASLGIPLTEGRMFEDRDTASAPHVALVSKSLAQEKWPNQDALGRQIEFGNMDGDPTLLTVIGVVGDVHSTSLEQPPIPTIYTNYRQRPQSTRDFTVVLRTAADPASLIRPAQEIVRDLDPTIPPRLSTFSQVFSASLESRRFTTLLMSVFSSTALLLAMAGIYGVISYSVAVRTREFGVRMALGADTGNVLKLVLTEGMRPVLVGIALGTGGGLLLARTMVSLLFGVSSTDPLTFATVALALGAVAFAACYIPARRATRVDPLVALRYE